MLADLCVVESASFASSSAPALSSSLQSLAQPADDLTVTAVSLAAPVPLSSVAAVIRP